LILSGAFHPVLKAGASAVSSAERFGAVERINNQGGSDDAKKEGGKDKPARGSRLVVTYFPDAL